MSALLAFLAAHRSEFEALFLPHVVLVVASTMVAIATGVPIGVLAARRPRIGAPIVWLANVVQTIPSLAMFGFLLPLPFVGGLGARVAIFVLILYALLPIIRTTAAGLRGIDRALIEAGTALGMTPGQLLRQVELPLAIPSIVAGLLIYVLSTLAPAVESRRVVRVGSKNFTEQIILGELIAQRIEQAGLGVERRLNLGGTFICDRALRSGDIDIYVEYTGTADIAVFKDPADTDPARVLTRVRDRYAAVGVTMLPPLGFENTFAILVREADARANGLQTIEDAARLADRWQAGFGYEFLERADGYPGLARKYGFRFTRPPRSARGRVRGREPDRFRRDP